MRVMDKGRAPGMQHRDEADAGAEMLGIGRDRQSSLRRGLEQQVVNNGLVLVCDVAERGRQRVHHVKVRHRQQFGLALREPFLRGSTLTLGAVPVAAGVVGDKRVRAVLATRDMPPSAAVRQRSIADITFN